jgi:putative tricarboxylic transport membrane protein
MKKADRIFGCISLGLALWCYLESTRLDYRTEFTPGPGFLPFWLGVALAVLSCYLIADSFLRKPGPKDDAKLLPAKHALFRVGAIVLMLIGVRIFMGILGFPLTLFVFTTAIFFLLERFSLVKSLAIGVAYAGVTWFIFDYSLSMGFPKGLVGI